MLVDTYSMDKMRKACPVGEDLSEEDKIKAAFYLGAAAFIHLITLAGSEIEDRQKIAVDLIHDEIDTELLMIEHKLKQ